VSVGPAPAVAPVRAAAPVASPPPRSALGADLLVSTGGLVLTRALTAVAGILVARLLGPSLRGDYALVALIAASAGTAATLGLEYWVARAAAQGLGEAPVRAVMRRHTRRATLALVVAGAGAAVALVGGHTGVGPPVVAAATGMAVGNVVSMLRLGLLGGQRRMARVAAAQALAAVTYVAAAAVLLVAGAASVAVVAAAAMASTAVLALATGTRSGQPRVAPRPEHLAEARRLGLPAMLGELATLAAHRLDLVVVAVLLGAGDVGRYAVALALAELLLIVPNGASQVLLPQVARDERGRATGPLVALTTVAGLLAALGLSLAGPALVPALFGDAFAGAVHALPWLAVATVALGAWKLLLADLAARGRTDLRVTTAVVATAVMLGADAVLVPRWGIGGAGMASLAAYGVAAGLAARAWIAGGGGSARDLCDVGAAWSLLAQAARRLRPASPLPPVPCRVDHRGRGRADNERGWLAAG
jgi:O-antigen/teichoic acid export membrane protein